MSLPVKKCQYLQNDGTCVWAMACWCFQSYQTLWGNGVGNNNANVELQPVEMPADETCCEHSDHGSVHICDPGDAGTRENPGEIEPDDVLAAVKAAIQGVDLLRDNEPTSPEELEQFPGFSQYGG